MRRYSLQVHLAIRFLAISVLPLAAVGLTARSCVHANVTRQVETANLLLADSTAAEAQALLREPLTAMREAVRLLPPDPPGPSAEINRVLASMVQGTQLFESAYLLDESRTVIGVGLMPGNANREQDVLGIDMSGQVLPSPAPQTPVEGRWSEVFFSLATGRQSLTLDLPHGRGLLVGNFSVEHFRVLVNPGRVSSTVKISIIDRRGMLIFQTGEDLGRQRISLRHALPVQRGLAGQSGSWAFRQEGRDYLGSVAPLQKTGWLVLVTQPAEVAYEPVRQMDNLFAVALVAATGLAALVSTLLASDLSRPLRRLSHQAAEIARGRYDLSATPQRYRESEDLAQSLRDMSSAIGQRERMLIEAHQMLQNVSRGTAGAVGSDFFAHLVESLAQALGVRHAVVAQWIGEPPARARTVAFWSDGRLRENIEYDLAGMPCESLREDSVCQFGSNVQGRFGDSVYLRELGIESYLGAAFFDAQGRVAGHLAVLHDRPLEVNEQHKSVLAIFAARAGAELERLRAQQSLAESEERYRSVFANSATVMLLIDPSDGAIVDANPAAVKFYGYSREQLCSMRLGQINTMPEPRLLETLAGALAGKRGPFLVQHRLADGTVRDVEAFSGVVPLGRQQLLFAIVHDVSDRIAAERRRDELESQLRQAARMEAVGHLAGGVAHDFNNLLQVIQGYTEMSLETLKDSGPAGEYLQEVRKAAQRASTLTRQLLIFSRRQAPQPRRVSLNENLSTLEKMTQRLIGEDVRLVLDLDPTLPAVCIDPGEFEQAILNLCVNARDAMPGGGTLTIATRVVELDEAACATRAWARPGRFACVSVCDTGTGMTPEVRQRVFDPFFTTKPPGKGTGLGLATVYGVVKRHQGLIDLQTELGRGTTFYLYFPAVQEGVSEAEAMGASDASPPPAGKGETILLAEDEQMVRGLAETILGNAGYKLLVARDGDEACGIIAGRASEIDLAILDLVMPGRSGRDVYDCLKAGNPQVRVIFTSGYSHDIISRYPLPQECALLAKPYEASELLRMVRQALEAPPTPSVE